MEQVIKFKRNPFIKYSGNLLVISYDELSFSITGYENLRKEGATIAEDLQPIPLTEEWLLEAGAEKIEGDTNVQFWKLMGIVFYESKGEYCIPIGYPLKGQPKALITFDKVHELQSIFDIKQTSIQSGTKQIG